MSVTTKLFNLGPEPGDGPFQERLTPPGQMPWAEIDKLGDKPFMPGGREQPKAPRDRGKNRMLTSLQPHS